MDQIEFYKRQIFCVMAYIEEGIQLELSIETLKYFVNEYIEECKRLHKNDK